MPRQFVDDLSIRPDAILLRRVPLPLARKAGLDEKGVPKFSTEMFQDASKAEAEGRGFPWQCMSVGLESVLVDLGLDAEAMRATPQFDGFGIAQFKVSDVRNLGTPPDNWAQGVMRDPTGTEPWHCVMFSLNTTKKTGGMQKALREVARWRLQPVLK